MSYDGKIIVLAFPDTFVKMSDELLCKILPLIGVGTRTHIKAGHAALVLIENKTGNAQYFDFGRYITPPGTGRVRSAVTDVELEIPISAVITNGRLKNLNELLLWLDAHPEKTHGSGRLVASLCESIDYTKALNYILALQDQGSIPYKAFGKTGSNCARFVTETILASTREVSIIKFLKRNKQFTPSTVGNVEKSASENTIYEIFEGKIERYNGTALRENLSNLFDKKVPSQLTALPEKMSLPENVHFLGGIGSSAYFHLEPVSETQGRVRRFTEYGHLDFEGITFFPKGFSATGEYTFVYDSNCAYCTVEQGTQRFRLELQQKKNPNSAQKVHSA